MNLRTLWSQLLSVSVILLVQSIERPPLKYSIEVRVLVDTTARDKWMNWMGSFQNMCDDLKSTMYQANVLFRFAMMNIEIRIKEITIVTIDLLEKDEMGKKDDTESVSKMKLLNAVLRASDNLKTDHDVLLYFTGYKLVDSLTKKTADSASIIGQACSKYGIAVVRMDAQNRATLIAQAIAHTLGAHHDTNKPECKAEDHYIMAPENSPNSGKRWEFSSCTKNEIKKYIETLNDKGQNCLLKTTADQLIFGRPGQYVLGKPEDVCKKFIGSNSFIATHEYNPGRYNFTICRAIYCNYAIKGSEYTSKPVYTPEAMVCGPGKRCYYGNCWPAGTTAAPQQDTVTSECPLGEPASMIEGIDVRCDQLSVSQCSSDFAKRLCCSSCKDKGESVGKKYYSLDGKEECIF